MKNTEFKITKTVKEDINNILKCYDSANTLFEESQRASGTYEIIKEVLDKTESYNIYFENKVIGWIAWTLQGQNSVLEALYVSRDIQDKGVASLLMNFYLDKMRNNNVVTVSLEVLKNANWAIQCYMKQGYKKYDSDHCSFQNNQYDDLVRYAKENCNYWSHILYKIL